jgi:hypothetical protein
VAWRTCACRRRHCVCEGGGKGVAHAFTSSAIARTT